MKKLLFIFLIYLLVSNIDGKQYNPHKPLKTCTITDVSTETVTSTITCSTEMPTLTSCPDNKQIPDECDSCKKTITTTCTPTTTICAPTSISEDACCSDGGIGRNGFLIDAADNWYNVIDSITTLEECCKACYNDPICIAYFINSGCFLTTFYNSTPYDCSTPYEANFPAGA
ncbi:2540_t:CDS:1, partial [Cetraspora pellucida]